MVTTVYRGVDWLPLRGEVLNAAADAHAGGAVRLDCQESITVSGEGRRLASKALSVGSDGRLHK